MKLSTETGKTELNVPAKVSADIKAHKTKEIRVNGSDNSIDVANQKI